MGFSNGLNHCDKYKKALRMVFTDDQTTNIQAFVLETTHFSRKLKALRKITADHGKSTLDNRKLDFLRHSKAFRQTSHKQRKHDFSSFKVLRKNNTRQWKMWLFASLKITGKCFVHWFYMLGKKKKFVTIHSAHKYSIGAKR